MRKRKLGYKLSRGQGARRALFRSLAKSLIGYGSIETTKSKAKFLQRRVDKLVNIAKKKDISSKRRVYSILGNDRSSSDKISNVIAPALNDLKGGYTRVINLPRRKGDFAEIARVEWVKEIVDKSNGKSKKVRGGGNSRKDRKRSLSKSKKETTKKTLRGSLKSLRGRRTARSSETKK